MATSRVTARIDRSSHDFPPGEAFEPYLAIRTMPLALLLAACGGAPFSVAEQVSALDVAGDAGTSSQEPGQVAQQVSDPPDAAPVPQQDAQAASHIDAGGEPDVAPEAASEAPETSVRVLPCSGATCAGCCDSAGVCQGGSDNAYCGTGGQLCNDCATSAQSCNTGTCSGPKVTADAGEPCGPSNCAGCCGLDTAYGPQMGQLVCFPGTAAPSLCGAGGVACIACANQCVNSTCR